jgi:hypothetical protein
MALDECNKWPFDLGIIILFAVLIADIQKVKTKRQRLERKFMFCFLWEFLK